MSLVLRRAVESDAERIVEIMYHAFAEDHWNKIMTPRIPPPTARTKSIERFRSQILRSPGIIIAVDLDRNETIAFARWSIYYTARSEREWRGSSRREWDEGTNEDAANAFSHAIAQKRQNIMGGDPHCRKYHHSRGCG